MGDLGLQEPAESQLGLQALAWGWELTSLSSKERVSLSTPGSPGLGDGDGDNMNLSSLPSLMCFVSFLFSTQVL